MTTKFSKRKNRLVTKVPKSSALKKEIKRKVAKMDRDKVPTSMKNYIKSAKSN